MCVEVISIALCTPGSTGDASGHCGMFHLVPGQHIICGEAHGDCIRRFGTCGKVVTKSPPRIAISEILNLPCASCAAGNDKVVKPFLHQGSRDCEEQLEQKFKALQITGHEGSACPSDTDGLVIKGNYAVDESVEDHALAQVDTDVVASAPTKASSVDDQEDTGQSAPTDVEHDEAVDPWTGASPEGSVITVPPSPSVKDDVAAVAAINDDDGSSVQASSDACKGDGKGDKRGTTIARRAVNFSYSAESAEKLRDTAQKFASLKSGFLMGKAS